MCQRSQPIPGLALQEAIPGMGRVVSARRHGAVGGNAKRPCVQATLVLGVLPQRDGSVPVQSEQRKRTQLGGPAGGRGGFLRRRGGRFAVVPASPRDDVSWRTPQAPATVPKFSATGCLGSLSLCLGRPTESGSRAQPVMGAKGGPKSEHATPAPLPPGGNTYPEVPGISSRQP